jgi:nitrate reductase gamma subunit
MFIVLGISCLLLIASAIINFVIAHEQGEKLHESALIAGGICVIVGTVGLVVLIVMNMVKDTVNVMQYAPQAMQFAEANPEVLAAL